MKRYIFYCLGLFFLFSQASFAAEDYDSEETEYDESTEDDTDSQQSSADEETEDELITQQTNKNQDLPSNLSTKQQVQLLVNNILGIGKTEQTTPNNKSNDKTKNTSVVNKSNTTDLSTDLISDSRISQEEPSLEDGIENISTINKKALSTNSISDNHIDYDKYLSENGAVVISLNDLLVLKNLSDKENKALNDLINKKNQKLKNLSKKLKINNKNRNKKARKKVSKNGTFYGRTIIYNGRRYKVKYFGKRKPLKTINYNIRKSYFSNKSRCNCGCFR